MTGRFRTRPGNRAGLSPCRPDGNPAVAGEGFLLSTLRRRQRKALRLCLAFWVALLAFFSPSSPSHAGPSIDSPAVLLTSNGAIASNIDVVSLLLGISWLRHDATLGADTRVMPVTVNNGTAFLPGPVGPTGMPFMGSIENPVATLLPLLAAGDAPLFANGEAVFFSAQYPSLANDPLAVDTASVRVRIFSSDGSLMDEEVLGITETAIDSGIFTGYFQNSPLGAGHRDGHVSLPPGARIELVDAEDIADGSLDSQIDAAIDNALPGTANLFIAKRALQANVSVGDFLPYEVTVENTTTAPAANVIVNDTLPRGFRYVPGSARRDGTVVAEPQQARDGIGLTFALGEITQGQSVVLRYVVEVTAGARPGQAVNTAQALAEGGVSSNPARAPVLVQEELFRSEAFVIGRVLVGECGQAQDNTTRGLAEVRLFMEDGTTVITDKFGRYHIAGIRAGTHVIQVDRESLPEGATLEPCNDNTRRAGNGASQFIDVQGGGLWRADFHVRLASEGTTEAPADSNPAAPAKSSGLNLRLTSNSNELGFIHYKTVLSGENASYDDLALVFKLDPRLQVVKGSTRRDGKAISFTRENGVRTLVLDPIAGDWSTTIEFEAISASDDMVRASTEDVDTVVWLASATLPEDEAPRASNSVRLASATGGNDVNLTVSTVFPPMSATLNATDRRKLDEVVARLRELEEPVITVTGHTDNIPVRPNPKKPPAFPDNHALSQARAQAVADYLRQQLRLPEEAFTVIGAGPDQPAFANDNLENRARNRRVEVAASSRTTREAGRISVITGDSGDMRLDTTPVVAAPDVVAAPASIVAAGAKNEQPEGQEKPLTPGIQDFVDGQRVAQRIQQVRVAMDTRLKPKLFVDGVEVPAARIGYRGIDRRSKMTLLSYIGVDFGERGERVLRVTGSDNFGNARLDQTVKIIRTGDIQDLRVIATGDNIADGRTPVTIKVELLDETRRVIPAGATLVLLESDLQPDTASDTGNALARNDQAVNVDPDGTIRFRPVTQSGRYHVRVAWAEDRAQDITVFVKPHFREWILVGVAEGTAAYRNLTGNEVQLSPEERASGLLTDGRAAFFARGKVRGEWLLTMAYDTDRERSDELTDRIDPNAWYTLYGDGSQQGRDAATQRKLYLKIERENFYALFGDFSTGLDSTELSRYQRRINGAKTEYWGQSIDVLAFASETRQAYVRDQIRGDGTAGLYRLGNSRIVPGSDDLRIEVRDRFRPEVVVEMRPLTPFLDYNLDPDAGTLWFKEPVRAQDENFNPVYIVVEYEVDNGIDDVSGGLRVVGRPLDRLQVAATAVHEGLGNGETMLAGVDARYTLDERNTLLAEYAATDSNLPGGSASPAGAVANGDAWLLRHEYRSEKLTLDNSIRMNGEGFGLGQQSTTDESRRRISSTANYNLSEELRLRGEVARSELLDAGRTRDAADVRISRATKSRDLFAGARAVRDADDIAMETTQSQQLLGGVRQRLLQDRLQLHAQAETNIADDDPESVDYPHRIGVGSDYRISPQATLFAEQEWGWGDGQDSQHSTAGVRYTPWNGAQANTSVGQELNEFGLRVYANAGLVQNWQIGGGWTMDAGLDRVQTLREPGTAPFDPEAVPANGDFADDFTAVFLGSGFQDGEWQWRGRIEARDGHDDDKLNVSSGLFRTFDEATTLGASVRYLRSDNDASNLLSTTATLQIDYAWRPMAGRWALLNQARQISDRRVRPGESLSGTRWVNNTVANWRYDERNETSIQYGARYVLDTIDSRQYSGYSDLIGVEYRHDITRQWDAGARTSVLHSWRNGQIDESWGVFVGYSPEKNIWVSLGYNFKGFRDNDFSGANYRDEGINLALRVKFDQDSVRAMAPKRNKLRAPQPPEGDDAQPIAAE
jgi:uncharacterized repeat protein (TIGR01451 family)